MSQRHFQVLKGFDITSLPVPCRIYIAPGWLTDGSEQVGKPVTSPCSQAEAPRVCLVSSKSQSPGLLHSPDFHPVELGH